MYIGDSLGTVLISLDKEHETLLRKLAQEHGIKKGSISKIVMQALDKLKADLQDTAIRERLKKRWKEGYNFKYTMYKNRNEIYD